MFELDEATLVKRGGPCHWHFIEIVRLPEWETSVAFTLSLNTPDLGRYRVLGLISR